MLTGKLMKYIALIILFNLFALPSNSAVISVIDDQSSDVKMVLVKGEIVEGDAEKFLLAIGNSKRAIVALESPGGLVREALQIGANIRQKGHATTVLADTECMSACALIWVAGVRRYMDDTSKIGVHAAYRFDGNSVQESGMANAEIGSYLTLLGLRIEAIRFFTAAPPNEIAILTPFDAVQLGIEIYLNSNGQRYTPTDIPTMDFLADVKASLLFAGGGCHKLFGFTEPAFKHEISKIEKSASIFDRDLWIELSLLTIEKYSKAPVFPIACLEAERKSRENGFVMFTTPSFNCAKASTAVEFAICRNQTLMAADRVMSSLYFAIKNANLTKIESEAIRDFQRSWLINRESCGDDFDCLIEYYERLIVFYHTFGVTPL
jgi:hypothetical protein